MNYQYGWNCNSERVRHKTASSDIIWAFHRTQIPKECFVTVQLKKCVAQTEKPLLDFFPYDTWFSSNYHPFSFIFCFCTLLFIPTMCKDRHLEKILYIYLYIWSIFIKRLPGSGPEAICWQPFLIPRLKAEKLISYKQTSKINHSICCWLSVKY